jgi:hypothetical protein
VPVWFELKLVEGIRSGGLFDGAEGRSVESRSVLGRSVADPSLDVDCFKTCSSNTIDCLFSSSSSSAISMRRRLLNELVEELIDPEAECIEQAADNVVSRSSLGVTIENSMLFGNRSSMAWKWTANRATDKKSAR